VNWEEAVRPGRYGTTRRPKVYGSGMRATGRFIAVTAALSVVLVALLLVGGFFIGRGYTDELRYRFTETGPAAAVVDLHDVGQLAAAFNHDAGTPRLVVLFSPT